MVKMIQMKLKNQRQDLVEFFFVRSFLSLNFTPKFLRPKLRYLVANFSTAKFFRRSLHDGKWYFRRYFLGLKFPPNFWRGGQNYLRRLANNILNLSTFFGTNIEIGRLPLSLLLLAPLSFLFASPCPPPATPLATAVDSHRYLHCRWSPPFHSSLGVDDAIPATAAAQITDLSCRWYRFRLMVTAALSPTTPIWR